MSSVLGGTFLAPAAATGATVGRNGWKTEPPATSHQQPLGLRGNRAHDAEVALQKITGAAVGKRPSCSRLIRPETIWAGERTCATFSW